MIKAILVDDEINALKSLIWEIENFAPELTVVGFYTDPDQAIQGINIMKPDCVFLDIEMPKMDGFNLLKNLEFQEFDLIFTTAYDEYAIEAFKVNAFDYLLKPIDSDDLKRAVKKIKSKRSRSVLGQEVKNLIESFQTRESARIAFQSSNKTLYFKPDEILFCMADGNYTNLFLTNHQKHLISKKIKEISEKLDQRFFRIHNSYVVNLNHVSAFDIRDNYVVIGDNENRLPVSRSKKQELKSLLNSNI